MREKGALIGQRFMKRVEKNARKEGQLKSSLGGGLKVSTTQLIRLESEREKWAILCHKKQKKDRALGEEGQGENGAITHREKKRGKQSSLGIFD